MKISKPKIVFLDSSTVGKVENLSKLAGIGEYTAYDYTLPEQRIERLKDCQIVITNKVVIDKEVMDTCPDLKLICIAATGMNNVDLEYAALKDIVVKNVAGYSTDSVVQSTFAMLLSLMHSVAFYDNYVKSGDYAQSRIFTHLGPAFWELKNKRFGIIGLGTIGKRVAAIARAFGAEVVYYSTSGKNLDAGFLHLSLAELLCTSDVLSIHCPLNDKTTNLIGAEQLKLMKPTCYLLNMGRGGIINEEALAEAIDKDWIAGAAIDVLMQEPIRNNNVLLNIKKKDKILITPHIAWTSIESRNLLINKIISNIIDFLENQ
jgi:lactate dehydrogenase-like 2-hydroxyacid dehydrogenase